MNEKFSKILMFAVILIAGFMVMRMCNPQGSEERRTSTVFTEPEGFVKANVPKASTIVLGMTEDKGTGKFSFADKRYKVGVSVSTDMAGVDEVLLNPADYSQTPKSKTPMVMIKSPEGKIKPFSVMGVKIEGYAGGDMTKLFFHRVWLESVGERKTDTSGVITSVTLRSSSDPWADGNQQIFSLVRTYSIKEGSYDVDIVTRVENMSGKELKITVNQFGSVNLPNDSLQGPSQYVQAGRFNGGKKSIEPEFLPHTPDASIIGEAFHKPDATKEAPREKFIGKIANSADKIVWTAQGNRFFAVVTRPEARRSPDVDPSAELKLDNGGVFKSADWIDSVSAMPMDITGKPEEIPVGIYIAGAQISIAKDQTTQLPLTVYMGPKKKDQLDGNTQAATGSEEYLRGILHYGKIISYSQSCAFCTFDWLIVPIGWLLEAFHTLVGNYGVAILLLTIVVRLALHPLTRYGQTKMAEMQKKMAAIAPEVEKVKKRYEKDKKQQQMELMRVYRENNVNPASGIMGCLPLLLQTPVWAALNGLLATAIALRHATFIPGWINDLSNPDMIAKIQTSFAFPILGITENGQHYVPINLLPIVLCVLYFFSMRMSMSNMPKSTDPTQQQTMKMQKWMFLLFPVILYNQPSGFNLYMVASTIGGMLDTWLIRKSLRAKGILPAATVSPM